MIITGDLEGDGEIRMPEESCQQPAENPLRVALPNGGLQAPVDGISRNPLP